jgi:hypothetical protein|eukprot:COSAG01_NODE_10952_length_2039_cov_270.024742_2_plen_82_part_00
MQLQEYCSASSASRIVMAEEEPVLPSAEPEPELELEPGPELEPEPEPKRGESAVVQDPDGAAGTSPSRMHRKYIHGHGKAL